LARSFVSVLIDTYNHERFIEQAIVSALEQDFSGGGSRNHHLWTMARRIGRRKS
jgi:glycosyltransferase involved in cell wall biosynthesis